MKIDVIRVEELDKDIQEQIKQELSVSASMKIKLTHKYRCAEFKSSRREQINQKNKLIKNRNLLVRAARENGKFYLEGGVLSSKQEEMFR